MGLKKQLAGPKPMDLKNPGYLRDCWKLQAVSVAVVAPIAAYACLKGDFSATKLDS